MFSQRWFYYILVFLIALLWTLSNPGFATTPVNSFENVESTAIVQNLEQQGKSLYDAGRFDEAISVLQQAAHQYQQQGDFLRQAIALSNLALTYQQQGVISEANQAIQQSLDLLQPLPSTSESLSVQAQVLDVQGRLQFTQGQAETALITWQQAARLYEQLEDSAGLVSNQIDQSRALQALGFYQRAIELLGQVLNLPDQVAISPECQFESNQTSINLEELLELKPSLIRRENRLCVLKTFLPSLPSSHNTAIALQALGEVLQRSGRLAQADVILQYSLELARMSATSEVTAAILLDLGNIARAQGNQEAALQRYHEAIDSGEAITQIRSQLNQLSLRIEQAEWEEAQLLLPLIQERLNILPLSQTSLYARINFAHSLIEGIEHLTVNTELNSTEYIIKLLSDTEEQARQLADWRAVAYAMGNLGKLYKVTQQWNEAQTSTWQAVELAQRVNASDIAYLWFWQLGQILKIQSEITTNITQQTKYITAAKTAYDEALQILKSIRYDLTSVSQDEQFNFRDAIEPAYRERAALLLQPSSGSQPSSEDLDATRTTIEELQIAELQNFLRQACDDAFVAIDQIVEDASGEQRDREQVDLKTAVIYPIILPEQLHVILKLPQQKELRHYSTAVKAEVVEQKLEELYTNLREPDKENTVKQLAKEIYDWLICPGKTELEDLDTLVFVLDGALKRIPMAVLYDGNHYLVENYSIALAQGLEMPSPQPVDRENIRLLLAGLGEGFQDEDFSPLQFVRQETQSIQQEISRSTVLLDHEFTAEALQNQIEQSRFQVIHLATHGEFSANQDDTFILAADRRINVVELAQVLRTRTQTQSEPLELLVLSACQTAQGDQRAALGLSGMAVRAGARSTIGSLWSVNDRSSAALMVEFYQQWREHSDYTKAKALQKAQIEIMKIYTAPHLWAPFILLGSWL